MAASTGLARISATTRRAFCAVSRTNRVVARVSVMDASCSRPRRLSRRRPRGRPRGRPRARPRGRCRGRGTFHLSLAVARMAVEGAGGSELPQVMADRVLRDEDRDELPPVVHREGEAHHLGCDGGAARPRLHHALLSRIDHRPHLLHEVRVDEGTLLDRACHALASLPPLHDPAIRALVVTRLVALGRLAPRGLRMIPLAAPLAAAVGGVDRIHRAAAYARADAEPAPAPRLAVRDVLVLEVADLADGGPTGEPDAPELAGGQLEKGIVAFLRHQLD